MSFDFLLSYLTFLSENCEVIIFIHYNDVIMGAIASQITSLMTVYSTVYSDADQRKHQSPASLSFVTVNFPHKWPVTRKIFPFDDVIMNLNGGMIRTITLVLLVLCALFVYSVATDGATILSVRYQLSTDVNQDYTEDNHGRPSTDTALSNVPLTRYIKLRVVHALGIAILACITARASRKSGLLTRGGGKTVPGIPGACTTRNFTYMARGPCITADDIGSIHTATKVVVSRCMYEARGWFRYY